jgi:tripartite-type tricarboxylate transporter receptor subunit TctC
MGGDHAQTRIIRVAAVEARERACTRLCGAVCAVAASLAALGCGGVSAQTGRTIKNVVPLPPGGAGDIVARVLADQVGRGEGLNIVTENRPGAGSVIGTEAVARADPDGNTLLINAPYLLIAPQVKKVGYDPLTSFEPVCYLVSSPGVIVVNRDSPYRTLAEFLNAARAQPGKLSIGQCRTCDCAARRT